MRGLYNTASQDAESEAELLRKALEKIAEIRAIRSERRIQAKNAGTVLVNEFIKYFFSVYQSL